MRLVVVVVVFLASWAPGSDVVVSLASWAPGSVGVVSLASWAPGNVVVASLASWAPGNARACVEELLRVVHLVDQVHHVVENGVEED